MLDIKRFKNVDAEYRSAPFWSWNSELEIKDLTKQIHQMYEQGIGGFFMHSRGGLKDEYLGDKFMKAIKGCVAEAKNLGMKAWLYDEDRFPSGSGAGMVTASNNDYRQKALEMVELPCAEIKKGNDVVKIYSFTKKDSQPHGLKDITELAGEDIKSLEGLALVFKVIFKPGEPRWSGQSYPDLSYKEAVDKFIETTYDKYKDLVGDEFNKTIPGIFTDEPHFNVNLGERVVLPWTYQLEEKFKEEKDYDILDFLPQLFYQIGDYKKVRFDFWDMMSKLFVKSFTQNIYNWCEENNVEFTGHYWEHVFPLPTHTGSVMPNYEYMQMPGIDMLFNTPEVGEQFGNDLIVKEVSSVANQLGKERVMSETYGASGWELNFTDQKKVADWQFALGINFVCQHLVLHSLEGYRKRDFPLSFAEHQPWWDTYHLMGDYIGRLSYLLSRGNFVGDILLLHPASSTWAEYNLLNDNTSLDELANSVKIISQKLSQIQYFFDLGDDILIEKYAEVTDNIFKIAEMNYKTIIVPDMTVMRNSNFKLLKKFAENGGHILTTGITPGLLDGKESRELKDFFNSDKVNRVSVQDLQEHLDKLENEHLSLVEKNGKSPDNIYCQQRDCGDQQILFMANISKEEEYQVRLNLESDYHLEEWDPVSGEINVLSIHQEDNSFYLNLDFQPIESHLIVVNKDKKAVVNMETSKEVNLEKILELKDWQVKRNDYNALTINCCQAKLSKKDWTKKENVNKVDDSLKDSLGIDRGHISAPQPWSYSKGEKDNTVDLQVRYTFNLQEELTGNLYLAVESPEIWDVFVNGELATATANYYKDKAFRLYNIKDIVTVGENEVILSTKDYGVLVNLEAIYVVGDFKLNSVDQEFVLVKEDEVIALGDWTQNGYPYYSGKMNYSSSFIVDQVAQVECSLEDLWAIVNRVIINGKEAGLLGWKPYQLDISDYLVEGENEIVIEVMNSLQNLLGPHDKLDPEGLVTPGSFYSDRSIKFVKSGFSGKGRIEVYGKNN